MLTIGRRQHCCVRWLQFFVFMTMRGAVAWLKSYKGRHLSTTRRSMLHGRFAPTTAASLRTLDRSTSTRIWDRGFQQNAKEMVSNDDDPSPKLEHMIRNVLGESTAAVVEDPNLTTVLVVGVSGGCDSVGLFHGLLNILSRESTKNDGNFSLQYGETEFHYNLHVVHFDHQLRGEESDGDRIFVQEICANSDVPFHCFLWNDENEEMNTTSFTQESARLWRRSNMGKLLQQLAGDNGQPGFILTAHHAYDSMESLLLKLLRGTHITNIKGMDALTKDSHGNWILRPLLGVKKHEISEYLVDRGLPWREDLSNNSNKYLRNQVRNELVPLLSEIMGGEDVLHKRLETLSRQSNEIRMDLQMRAERYLAEINSGSSFQIPVSHFELVHKEAIHLWLTRNTGGLSFNSYQLDRVCRQLVEEPDNLEWRFNIGHGWDIVREGGVLLLDTERGSDLNIEELSWKLTSVEDDSGLKEHELEVYVPTADHIEGFYLSNIRSANLMFTPTWRKGRSPTKASQFLRGQKIPLHERRGARIVFARHHGGQKSAVAIEIPSKGDWLLDAFFDCDARRETAKRVLITLPNT